MAADSSLITEAGRKLGALLWQVKLRVWLSRFWPRLVWWTVLWAYAWVLTEAWLRTLGMELSGWHSVFLWGFGAVSALLAALSLWPRTTDTRAAAILDASARTGTLATAVLYVDEPDFKRLVAAKFINDYSELKPEIAVPVYTPTRAFAYLVLAGLLHVAALKTPLPPPVVISQFGLAPEVKFSVSVPSFTEDPAFVAEKQELKDLLREARMRGDAKAVQHLQALLRIMNDLEKGRISLQEAMAKLDRLSLSEKQDDPVTSALEKAMTSMGRELRKTGFRKLGKALMRMDEQAVQRRILELERAHKQRKLDRALEKSAANAAKSLEKLAKRLARKASALRGEARKAALHRAETMRRAARMARSMKSARELAKRFRDAAQKARRSGNENRARQLERAARRLSRKGSGPRSAVKSAMRQWSEGRKGQLSRTRAAQASRDVRDMLRRLRNTRRNRGHGRRKKSTTNKGIGKGNRCSGASPTRGNSDGRGGASQNGTGKRPSYGDGRLRSRGPGSGPSHIPARQGQQGQGRPNNGQGRQSGESARDFLRRARGGRRQGRQGQRQGQRQGRGRQGRQGQRQGHGSGMHTGSDGMDSPSGSQAGRGSDPGLFGREQRLDVSSKDESMDPRRHAQGQSRRKVLMDASGKGFTSRSYKRVYVKYRESAGKILHRHDIPPSYEHLIKVYYKLIRPGIQ